MIDRLFVYGSLMHNIQSEVARYLHQNSNFLGEGKLQGQLFDLGEYPGAVYQQGGEDWISGHLVQLHNPHTLFPFLDRYEMIDPDFPAENEYIRLVAPVYRGAERLDAWVYLYNQSTTGLPLIPNGNYLHYLRNNQQYQAFVKSLGNHRNGE